MGVRELSRMQQEGCQVKRCREGTVPEKLDCTIGNQRADMEKWSSGNNEWEK